jgi:hypothetical protein
MPAAVPAVAAHERFLQAFTPEIARQVMALPGLLEEHRGSVVVFTARKSVCLADALRRLGYWHPRGDFTSNRALDGDMSLFAGRDCFIVEDLAASCRTLLSTIEAVRASGASSITCFALTVEGPRLEWEKVLGAEFTSPYLESHIGDSLRHARSVVDAFATLPRPYNIDWPVHAFKRDITPAQVTDAGWRRITPDVSRAGAISVEPGRALRVAAARVLPPWVIDVFEASHLSKVRLYPVADPHRQGTKVFGVPVVALGAMSGTDVTRHLRSLTDTLGVHPLALTSTREAYRVLQFLLGDVLLQLFGVSLGVASPPRDDSAAEFLFLPGVKEQVLDAQGAVRRWAGAVPWQQGQSPLPVSMLPWDDVDRAAAERRAADDYLADLFADSYLHSTEYGLRNELRTASDQGARRRIVRRLVGVDRATDGASFTAGELRERMLRDCPGLAQFHDPRELVSAFLDRAIDAGEVVPDLDIDVATDVATRRFRPGEIIPFERDTQAGVESMLRGYARHAGRDTFSVDLLQKLIVGYVGFLLDRSRMIDQRPAGPSARDIDRLQRRYHLRGAILDEVSADFVGQKSEPEVARRLLSSGVIVRGDKRGYVLAPEPALQRLHGPDLDATIFGRVLADIMALRNDRGRPQLDEDDLGRLVTLITPVDDVLALGADMIIAAQHMREDRALADVVVTVVLRDAINNGLAKAAWVDDNSSKRLINAIEKRLPKDDDIYHASAMSVLDALTRKDGDSLAKREARRLIEWFRDTHVWWMWLRLRVGGGTAEEREERFARDLRNRAFLVIGGLDAKPRGGKARDRLRRHLLGEQEVPPGEWDELSTLVRSELLDVAATLREQCYKINSPASERATTIKACLLAAADADTQVDFSAIKGVQRPLLPTNSAGEKLLGHFDMLIPLAESFDLAAEGQGLLDALAARRMDAVMLVDLPERFRARRVVDQQVALLSHEFVELVELAGDGTGISEHLSTLMPARASSDIAVTVRGAGEQVATTGLLNCIWEQWLYSPPGQQLLLAEPTAGEPPTPAVGHPGPQITIHTMNVHNDGSTNIDASTHIDLRGIALELNRVHQVLEQRSLISPAELEALEAARADAERGDETGVRKWAKTAGSAVGDVVKELGLELLKRVIFPEPPAG